jgi:hypothetical protein
MKCKIQWVSAASGWKPTPDNNEAVGWATCDHSTGGNPLGGPLRVFPICAEHMKQMSPNWSLVHIEGLEAHSAEQRMIGYKQGQLDLVEQLEQVIPRREELK